MANFADLLKKIANNSRLTPQELDELGRFGTETQQRNSQTANMSGFNGAPYFPNGLASGGDLIIGKSIISTTTARVKRISSQTASSSTNTKIQWESIEFGDGFLIDLNADNTKINILTTGVYKIFFGLTWQITAGYGIISTLKNGTLYYPSSMLPVISGTIMTHSAYDERLLVAGDYLQLQAYQTSGSSADVLSAFLAAGKIMSY